LRSYPAAKAEMAELANVKHVFLKAAARLNNRAENSHQPTRERERRMRGFRDPNRTQAFLSYFGPIRQHFSLKRHLLRASLYRKQLAARFVAVVCTQSCTVVSRYLLGDPHIEFLIAKTLLSTIRRTPRKRRGKPCAAFICRY